MSPEDDLRELWWAVQRLQDQLRKERADFNQAVRRISELEVRVNRLESK